MLALCAPYPDAPPSPDSLVIGLVNNMPGRAVHHAERQFCHLLSGASRGLVVWLQFFSLKDDHDGNDPTRSIPYGGLAQLELTRLDGLIVTGAPPCQPDLKLEPSWQSMTELIDLARERRIPTIWSCLAAHMAALHLHGIPRRRLARKLSGVVACERAEPLHPLMARLPARWQVPHSRYNELPETELSRAGYHVLSRSAQAGADIFVHEELAPFIFLQGHPEYEATTLLREYCRDVSAFLSGASDDHPDIPSGYFRPRAAALLARLREDAIRTRDPDLLTRLPLSECEQGLVASWQGVALRFWTNWLHQLGRASNRPAMAEPALA